MDYLKYGKKAQQQPQKSQPQGFGKNVQITEDDFSFGDLTNFDYADGVNPTNSKNKEFFGKQPQPQPQPQQHINLQSSNNELGDELMNLFPVPILICPCPFKYDQELELFRKEPCNRKDSAPIDSNSHSDDTFILDRPELARIRSWIEEKLKIFMKDLLSAKCGVTITQSWLNRNKKNERHHTHAHPNSFVSGIWYPYIHEKLPPIEFKKQNEMAIQPEIEQFNIYNSGSFMLPMRMGELILFPSNLQHSVPANQSDEDRISLSFNTWIKGDIGDKEKLTYLPLDRCV